MILAGGRGRRMGRDKARLPFGAGTLLQHQVARMRELFDEVLVASGQADRYPEAGAPGVADRFARHCALAGIQAGLSAARCGHVFVLACDTPFATPALIRSLTDRADKADWILPSTVLGFQPLFSVYSQACLEPIERMLEAGELRIAGLAKLVNTLYVYEPELRLIDPELRSFTNINTPEDLARHLS